ncbi:hypothetical protein FA10DRAFT_49375, partial [Acaromyces ingoldii]
MSASRHHTSPSTARSYDTANISPSELLFSQAYTSLPAPFAMSASPSSTDQQRSGEWSSSEVAQILLTEQLPQFLPTVKSSEQGQHHFQASDEPARDFSWTPISHPSSSPLSSWPSQSSLDLQFSPSNSRALRNASQNHDRPSTPFEQHQVHQKTLQFSQNDEFQWGEDKSWEQQLATSLFGDFLSPPISEVTPSSSSLPAAALYANVNVNANTIYSTPLVSPEDRQLTQAGAYALFPAFPGPPSPQNPSPSEIYNSTDRSLQSGAGSSIEPLSVAAIPVDLPKRVSAACRFCKARKLRCDGCHPCRQCQRRCVACFYQPEAQVRPSRRMTDPSFEAFRSTTAPTLSEGQGSNKHTNQRKRSYTSVAEASLGFHTPYIPASTSGRSRSSCDFTSHSADDSIAASSVSVIAGDSADAYRQESSSNSSFKTFKREDRTSSGLSSAIESNNKQAFPIHGNYRNSGKGGKKSIFSTISIRSRPVGNRNFSEMSAAQEVR